MRFAVGLHFSTRKEKQHPSRGTTFGLAAAAGLISTPFGRFSRHQLGAHRGAQPERGRVPAGERGGRGLAATQAPHAPAQPPPPGGSQGRWRRRLRSTSTSLAVPINGNRA